MARGRFLCDRGLSTEMARGCFDRTRRVGQVDKVGLSLIRFDEEEDDDAKVFTFLLGMGQASSLSFRRRDVASSAASICTQIVEKTSMVSGALERAILQIDRGMARLPHEHPSGSCTYGTWRVGGGNRPLIIVVSLELMMGWRVWDGFDNAEVMFRRWDSHFRGFYSKIMTRIEQILLFKNRGGAVSMRFS